MEARDTSLIEALNALERERERLAYALESSRIAMWDFDVPSGVIDFSVEWSRMIGSGPCEIQSTVATELARVPAEERDAVRTAIPGVLKGDERQYDLTHRVGRLDATSFWCRSRGRVTRRSSDGRAIRMIGTNVDVSEWVERERLLREREEELRLITDNVPVMINLLDAEFRYLFVNLPYLRFFGLEREAVLGRTLAEVAGAEAQEVAASFLPRLRTGETIVHERSRTDPQGRTRHFEIRLVPRLEEHRRFAGTYTLIDDVTERREAARRVELAAQHLRQLADGVDSLIAHFDLEAQLLFANRRYREWFGIADESIPGLPASAFAGVEAMQVLLSHMPAIRRGESVAYEVERKRGAETHEFEMRLEPQWGTSGAVEGVYAVLNDITARKSVERGLAHQAFTDPVTTLPNRRLLLDRLEIAVARAHRTRSSFALLCLDLDGFKPVNDTLGHDAGDELLRRVGERLAACVRASDTVARVGGDEFALLLDPVGSAGDAEVVASKVRASLQAPFGLTDGEARISASVGVSMHPRDGEDAPALVRAADAAMYRAKAAGKSRAMRVE